MSPTFWVKKKFAPLKTHKASNRWLLPRTSSASATTLEVPLIPEVVTAADLGCGKCQKRTSQVISDVDDVESMVVHLLDKKVMLTRKSVHKGSLRNVSAFCRKLSHKA